MFYRTKYAFLTSALIRREPFQSLEAERNTSKHRRMVLGVDIHQVLQHKWHLFLPISLISVSKEEVRLAYSRHNLRTLRLLQNSCRHHTISPDGYNLGLPLAIHQILCFDSNPPS